MTEQLAAPDRAEYEPFLPTPEQARFILRFYELDPRTGKRKVRRGVISRPRGWGKSPFLAAIACAEALADVVPDGWDENGQPVGKPWSAVRTPLVQIAAVSEEQTANSWSPLLEMLRTGPVLHTYGIDPLDTFVVLPGGRGRIERRTSAGSSIKGARAVHAVLDQTEEWSKGNGGHKLSETMLDNATKVGGTTIESPNAFTPGEDSVAERTATSYSMMLEGKTRMDHGILWDHREAPADTDLTDGDSLLAGLAFAYGDSAEVNGGWVDLEHVRARIWDPDMDPQLARGDFLNQITHASDSWLSQPEWKACYDPGKRLAERDVITVGFDGSRGRERGVADATALVAVRVSDGHAEPLGIWEQPLDWPVNADSWTPPEHEVDAAVHAAFTRFQVIGFYADPTMWDEHVARWQARYLARLKVKATTGNPVRWPKSALSRVVPALKSLHQAVLAGEMTHNGDSTLGRHVINARRRTSRSGVYIAKENPSSPRKIDAAYALMLAWQARLDALAAGLGEPERETVGFRRLR